MSIDTKISYIYSKNDFYREFEQQINFGETSRKSFFLLYLLYINYRLTTKIDT